MSYYLEVNFLVYVLKKIINWLCQILILHQCSTVPHNVPGKVCTFNENRGLDNNSTQVELSMECNSSAHGG